MVVDTIQIMTDLLSSIAHWSDTVQQIDWRSPEHWTVLAQYIKDPDVLGQMQKTFENFIKSGQAWALAIGVILGYLIRGITA